MPKAHFDCAALVDTVYAQPIGIHISTNHPKGFRRLMYQHLQNDPRGLNILQSPTSANAFLLTRTDLNMEPINGG